MIKVKTTRGDGAPLYILGLSAENIALLKNGKPIHVDLAKMGGPLAGSVVIFAGETEEAMFAELNSGGHIDSSTIFFYGEPHLSD